MCCVEYVCESEKKQSCKKSMCCVEYVCESEKKQSCKKSMCCFEYACESQEKNMCVSLVLGVLSDQWRQCVLEYVFI